MIKGLLRSWNQYAKQVMIDDELTEQQLIEHSRIVDYQLSIRRYPLKGTKIPSFIGNVTLQTSGPEPLVRLVNMLLAFSEYSGIGIKPTLGMGGCRVQGISQR